MPINILMPALSPTMEKGNLAKWLKKEGDKVKSGDVIAEIETDKATMEVEAVDEGTIAKILVPEGTQDVPVNDVIAVLAGDGEDVKAAASAGAGAAPAPKPAEPPKPAAQAAAAAAPAPTAAPAPSAAPVPQPAAAPAAQANGHARVFSSPLARRLAKEAGIDLGRITGTGPHGRVIARDVDDAKSGKGLKAPAAAPAAAGPSIAPSMSDKQILALFEPGSYEVVPHDGMRRTIAQRLTASVQNVPHFYLTIDCDIGKLLAAREEINAAAPKDKEKKPLYKISVNDFVIKAMAVALQKIPNCNVSWTEGGMLKHKHSDVGVAVAMPGGLITPIIRKAETKTLSTISNEMKDFAARARARKLKPEEYQGGTTAVSNLGMYGINHFTAVINPPHASILAVGTSEERPVVRGGKIEIANIMSVTLSCDHRAIDGALGAELIGAFKQLIENPVMMMV
ncbi:pyruvate dehydrogenase complex dihydrolipoamide acetyltransferase [Bradyrhizobium viridifuturi]|jgi:pyruvate dehydrogenase E2 component (dihydrolipoamide acetyltransferase)|uniref:pyruvate dehydrogenase complex dihydrolipoamide acetyltransferase n=2 Tax=Nitrobacteraceae TaxID=41294 RepID=UPI0003969FD6|nr:MULTISPECIES: pyruvate dehydrogenase complex dihydrolipoamide acetyltransferase [Bradyrhizobium]ERF85772.1 MAG: pyruvate dehydrogenase complex dihydrolipoamide acetyltransferase [Bradyrhizobium sp. DFCI-1]OYU63119.1 MAG: pyruvate dehydrogenase complex dihydrolipoamide acetyltransferase [Bradyrhizobium sp. PARBB1]PSO23503.1 pyruvate dehydrogenase complex dihydrolipoamide acetyltransferase [Bradyrhizobium sp. MOS004]QRI73073.1 pyruvate dehydrogenase complex dihydrolipoamide acetyltransferase [